MRIVSGIIVLALAGCQQVEAFRKPELAACQSFIISGLKSPSSYKRIDYTVIDQPVSNGLLSKAVGLSGNALLDKDIADGFVNPNIRDVLINYEAANAFGASLRSAASCRFAVSDGQYVVSSPQDAADAATSENQRRMLNAAVSGVEAESADCCLSKDFKLIDLSAEERNGNFSLYDEGKQ